LNSTYNKPNYKRYLASKSLRIILQSIYVIGEFFTGPAFLCNMNSDIFKSIVTKTLGVMGELFSG